MNNIKYLIFLALFGVGIFLVSGCEENPTSLGLKYVPPSDTLGTVLLDSQNDTMAISGYTKLKYTNCYSAYNSLVGKYQNYESRALLKFSSLPGTYDSCTVLSASLRLTFNNYYFQDSLGITAFNIYPLTDTISFSTTTVSNFNNAIIGPNSVGNYTGSFSDTAVLNLSLDTSLVRKWLWVAASSAYSFQNDGIIFVPTSSCNTIRGFINSTISAYPDSLKPQIKAIVLKGGVQDTIEFLATESNNLNTAPLPVSLPNRYFVYSGISYQTIMNMDISKLPANVTVNQAMLTLKLDKANSFIYNGTDQRVGASLLTDTAAITNDGYTYYSASADTLFYNIIITHIIQKWNFNTQNLGIALNYIYEAQGLNRLIFYSNTDPDPANRPRLRIRYTPRINSSSKKNQIEKSNEKTLD